MNFLDNTIPSKKSDGSPEKVWGRGGHGGLLRDGVENFERLGCGYCDRHVS